MKYSNEEELLKIFRNGIDNELEIMHLHLESIKEDILAGIHIKEGANLEEELENHQFECDRSTFDEIFPVLMALKIPVEKVPSYPYKVFIDGEYQGTEYLYDYNDIVEIFKELDDYMYFVTMIYITQNLHNTELWHGVSKKVKEALRKLNVKIPDYGKTVFVAMSFDEELKLLREKLIRVIRENGFKPIIIDSKEHNNQIVPEIFYEIDKAEFVVADLTHHKAGVYYEAGYAKGVGKEVIFTCNSKDFKKRHFDVAQTNTIVWETPRELEHKLTARIEAMYLIESSEV